MLISLVVPFLKLTKGNIVCLTGSAGETPLPGGVIFSTSKAMVNMLVKCTALETAYFGIRVNAVAPGVTWSDARMKEENMKLSASDNKAFLTEACKEVPLNNEINDPKDVACSILWLASSQSSFCTGEVLTVDGGQSLATTNYAVFEKEAVSVNRVLILCRKDIRLTG